MYELVNTSVPNGLIPGTHGFATVAMTKGIPDAIRSRIENFCAYPHRTSAHDESYLRENPVNWFHLALPNKGHVIGCTAPCDFDYTGRTNRLARTILLKGDEMPSAGGVAALRIAGSRLLEPWSGEPRMLQPDKALAAKFFAANRAADPRPQNWIALFGECGEELARRTAILVAQNVAGRGKSLYFKTSTKWDVDGTKLLGLFGDLIALIPDEVAPHVTFSTFSPCVPGGTPCHLRGVYDKDNAFELASATQPWIDCENGRVMHEEMLPVESAQSEAKTIGGGGIAEGAATATQAASSRIGLVVDPAEQKRQAEKNLADRWRGAFPAPKEDSDKTFNVILILGVLAAIVLCAAVGWFFCLDQPSSSHSTQGDDLLELAKAEQAAEKEEAEQQARDNAQREEIAQKERADEEKRKQADLAEKKKAEEDKKAEEAKAEAQRLSEEAKSKQKEETRQTEEDLAKAKKENLDVSLDQLKITKVIDMNKLVGLKTFEIVENKKPDKEQYPLAQYAAIVTNANSVVVYYAENGKVNSAMCHYKTKSIKKMIGNSKPKMQYTLEGWPDKKAKDSPWLVLRVINPEFGKGDGERSKAVFWSWNESGPRHTWFENKNKVDLKKACFVCDEAYNLYAAFRKVIYKVVRAVGSGERGLNTISPILEIETYRPQKTELDSRINDLRKQKSKVEQEKNGVDEKISKAEKTKKKVEGWENELAHKNDEKEKEKDKGEKKKKSTEITKRKNDINAEAVKLLEELGILGQQLTGNGPEQDRILKDIDNKIDRWKREKDEIEKRLADISGKIEKEKKDAGNWMESVRRCRFAVTAIESVGDKGDGNEYEIKEGVSSK